MSPVKHLIPNPYSFELLEDKLSDLGIIWDKRKGKGSHGAFRGLDLSGRKQSFTIPHTQQKEVKKQMLNKLRDRFQLNGSNLDAFFATRK